MKFPHSLDFCTEKNRAKVKVLTPFFVVASSKRRDMGFSDALEDLDGPGDLPSTNSDAHLNPNEMDDFYRNDFNVTSSSSTQRIQGIQQPSIGSYSRYLPYASSHFHL
jgi:hypothetical protein